MHQLLGRLQYTTVRLMTRCSPMQAYIVFKGFSSFKDLNCTQELTIKKKLIIPLEDAK